ncbi:antibiotic biosynthesis monooxygenase [Frankia sp. AgB1.9]|uniref:antibiotic biosynthesis monooxygenase n=1 Tax=unclassified Frankia TaxID=2632575 RepID=UPI001932265C|nr:MULTISPECIES: antibiotic biosynthesis monooxygenase [unclassified Frankia]MBL7491818.1 antibiotic biosynthesis monooxygenase [Frankia sp. AgW1.1]MBL7549757.1 antibiotic biosynthesis monooxygenase [Frankia sp. AgB1.9]MBL7624824.1 antibiotic biosynthesis monooxygenase [Frankia sp. AgB1.8]
MVEVSRHDGVGGVSGGGAATAVVTVDVREGRERDYLRWQRRTDDAARLRAGFEAVELYPPASDDDHSWVVVFRFGTVGELRGWLDSPDRRRLLDEGRDLFSGPGSQEILAGDPPDQATVTAVVAHDVRPGHEAGFLAWQEKAHKVQKATAGFRGYELFRPVPGVQERWVAVFRYDSMRHLEEWLGSPARRQLIDDGQAHITGFDVRKVGSAFSGWFRFGEARGSDEQAPPSWKQAMMVLLALYPTVMVLSITVSDALTGARLPDFLVFFIGNILSVAALTWLLMPLANRAFGFWLVPGVARTWRRNALGAALVVACYGLALLVFGLTTA